MVVEAQELPRAGRTTINNNKTPRPTWRWDEDYGMSSGDEEDTDRGLTPEI